MNRTKANITRRDLLYLAGLTAVGACAGEKVGKRKDPAAGAAGRPNILWITCEDMSPDLGCWGDDYARTPNIDRLAAASVKYTAAFATAPVCSPVRSCLITGLYATSAGTPNLRSRFPLPDRVRGFPSYLREAGYFCTNNVKTDYNTADEKRLIRESWDACSGKAHWRLRKDDRPFFSIFNDMVTHQSRSMVWPYEKFKKQVQARLPAARRHDPATAPVPPYYPDTPVVRRTVARYYDCISVMDMNTGRILKQLEEDGLADDTIVFFFSDHGAGMPRHKRLVLDSGLHVPLLVRFPEKYRHLAPAAPGETVDRPVSFVDFPPTVLSLAGLRPPDYLQGRAFLGPAAGAAEPRTYVYAARDRVDEAYDLARCVRGPRYHYVRNFMPHLSYNQPSFYADRGEIRDEITALAAADKLETAPQKHYAGPRRAIEELYDCEKDPRQLNNLAGSGDHAAVLERMRGLMTDWIMHTRDTGFLPESDMARRMGDGSPLRMASDPAVYPLEKILRTAEMVGREGVEAGQVAALGDGDPAVRFWAAVGLHAAGGTSARGVAALEKALGDDSPPVRIEAAWALCDAGETGRAVAVLEKDLRAADLRVAIRAARALQMIGVKARPALGAMKAVLRKAKAGTGDKNMFIRFALQPAVANLE